MILVCSDLHLSDNPRDQYRFIFVREKLPALIKKYQVKELRILGDLCESKDHHSAKLVNDVVASLDALAELTDILMLKGNHDYTEPDYPFFGFMRLLPNVRFIINPTRVGSTLYLPHTHTPEKDWKVFRKTEGIKLIFAHQTFAGAVGSFGRKLEGAQLEWLPDAPVISGDVHVPQGFDNLTYVGAPYTVDFGDEYNGRVLLIDGERPRSVPITMPQKWIWRVDDLGALQSDFLEGDVLRIEVPIKGKDYAQWGSVLSLLRAWGADQKVKIDSIIPLITDKRDRPTQKRQIEATDDRQILQQYGKVHKLDERTLKVGLELLT